MNDVQLISWAVSNEEYAVEIENIQEIVRVTDITRMPFSQHYLPGVINLRGMVVPVMDMAKRLHLPELTLSDSSRIIIVARGGITAGLLVDRVSEVVKLDLSYIESQDILSSAESTIKYIKGIAKLGERVLLILDMDRIFELDDE